MDPAAHGAGRRPLFDATLGELESFVTEHGGRPFHARVVHREVLERGVRDWQAMTGLSKDLRSALDDRFTILAGEEITRSEASDGAIKLLTGFGPDAETRQRNSVETVFIPALKSKRGATLCVSTQIGCPVRCPFCASGALGLARNLSSAEIIEQYLRGADLGPLSRSVVMGIGEPLLNYPALAAALAIVQPGIGLGTRKITVSTVGFPDRLRRIAEDDPPFQLAISLHTPFDDERDQLVPAMAGTAIKDVLEAGDYWFAKTGREITYEYVLLGGSNDSPAHADALVERLSGRRANVNLIPFNPIDPIDPINGGNYARPDSYTVSEFQRALQQGGLVATVRWSRGVEADAACGQLRIRN